MTNRHHYSISADGEDLCHGDLCLDTLFQVDPVKQGHVRATSWIGPTTHSPTNPPQSPFSDDQESLQRQKRMTRISGVIVRIRERKEEMVEELRRFGMTLPARGEPVRFRHSRRHSVV